MLREAVLIKVVLTLLLLHGVLVYYISVTLDDAMDAQISPSQLQTLYTLSFSDNRELQLSAASCYAEVSERG